MFPQGASGQRKSNIPVGRLSRGRLSNLSTQKSARSSSAGRHLSAINPLQLFTSKRSTSCTNLKEPSTPICYLGRPSGTTPRSLSAHKYPINDKQWQSSQLTKVKNFFLERDPEMPPLKPLNLRIFVHTMDLLLGELDNRIKITAANYKDEVPKYYKLLKYPHQIKASVLKNPGVPSNWAHIYAMWVWLIDRLSWMQNYEAVLRPATINPDTLDLYELSTEYMVNRYLLWNNGQDETQADKDFQNDVARTLNVDLTNIESAKLELNTLELEANELKTTLQNISIEKRKAIDRAEELSQKNMAKETYRRKLEHDLLARRTELLNRKEVRASLIKAKSENIAALKETIRKQTCSYEEKCKLKDQIAELEYARKLKLKHRDERLDLISQVDMQLSEERQRVQERVFEINSVLSKNRVRPELMELKLRETGFFQSDMIDEVKTFLEKKKQFDLKLQEEEENQIKMLKEVQERNKEVVLENEQLEKRISKLSEEISSAQDDLDRFRTKAKKDIETAETKEQQMITLIAEMKAQRPNVAEMQEKLAGAYKRKAELEAERDSLIEKGEEFFANIYKTTLNTIAAQAEMVQDITRTANEALYHNSDSDEHSLN